MPQAQHGTGCQAVILSVTYLKILPPALVRQMMAGYDVHLSGQIHQGNSNPEEPDLLLRCES